VDADVQMAFALYATASGGAPLWSEVQSVAVTGGIYNVQLGSVTGFPAGLFTHPLYLGVTVADDAEMTPRQLLTATAFAMRAQKADTVADGVVNTVQLADNAVTGVKIGNGTVEAVDLKDGTVLAEIADDDGAGSGLDADQLDGLDSSVFAQKNGSLQTNLNADTVDGQHASAFAINGHNHDAAYVNATGDSMSSYWIGAVLSVTNTGTGTGVYGSAAVAAGV